MGAGRAERVLATAGAGLGLVIVAGAASVAVRSMNSVQSDWRDDPWRFVIVGFGALPYLLALSASLGGARRWVARCAVLGAATLLSFAVTVATGFSIGFLFLAPTLLLGAATVAALVSRPREATGAPLAAGLALGVVLAWVGGIVALFTGPATERCWRTLSYVDGRVERAAYEHRVGEPLELLPAPPDALQSVSCSSDVVTSTEALRSGALLLGAGLLGWLALRPVPFAAAPPGGAGA